ncbi:MAG: GntR family transcriptional regulator [Gammaproteobacteria bacterium]|jgi:DNA-binding GntR family transcriptional regulator|nr:GntR family transcriptional regulator [Gammaproteobacteria bacterium]MCP4880744.1 GntR family transcriptional regulator [Gammaproteobacteria bacterium]MDP6164543.1 GntR family transcriptional regulator [Gammaproteobacteria bacterium]
MTYKGLDKIDFQPVTLRDQVQERMREAIIEGHFKPGERLVERPLCDQLGVSRTVVRETIRYLEAEGLVQIAPNRGPIVAYLYWKEAKQIYAIRRMLEMAAAEACAANISKALAQSLRAALEHLNNDRALMSATELYHATSDFYELIFSGAGHDIAWEVVQRFHARISRLRRLTLSSSKRRQSGPEHMQAICDAICAGDPIASRNAVGNHLDDVMQVAEQLLKNGEDY